MTIKDEFATARVSKQKRYELRRAAKKQCLRCKTKAVQGKTLCKSHLESDRIRKQQARKLAAKKR